MQEGQILSGRYRVVSVLGRGGMGEVWAGVHTGTGRKVAIKLLDEKFLDNPSIVERFGREARAASAIEHPGIADVLDLDRTETGLPYLVMEFLQGETLGQRIQALGKLTEAKAVDVMCQLLEALDAAHEGGIVHRDLKPDNIFLVPKGPGREVVKILDFGISQKADEASMKKLTQVGSVLGTPHYMCPEQAIGQEILDGRADIYSAGVVLYECVVGDVPFDADNYNALLNTILRENPIPPSKRGANISAAVERVIMMALEKDKEKRPQTAGQMRAMLLATIQPKSDPAASSAQIAAMSVAAPFAVTQLSSPGLPAIAAPVAASVQTPHRGSVSLGGWGDLDSVMSAPPAAAPQPSQSLSAAAAVAPMPAMPSLPAPPPKPAAEAKTSFSGGGFNELDEMESGADLELDAIAPVAPRQLPGQHRMLAAEAQAAAGRTGAAVRAVNTPVASMSSARMQSVMGGSINEKPGTSERDMMESVRAAKKRATELPSWVWKAVGALVVFICLVVVGRQIIDPKAGLKDIPPQPPIDSPLPDSTAQPASPTVEEAPAAANGTPQSTESVSLDISGMPSTALILLDGIPATSPIRVIKGTEHNVEIRADGFERRYLKIKPLHSGKLNADMQRLPTNWGQKTHGR